MKPAIIYHHCKLINEKYKEKGANIIDANWERRGK